MYVCMQHNLGFLSVSHDYIDTDGIYENMTENRKYLPQCHGNQCWNRVTHCCDDLKTIIENNNETVHGVAFWSWTFISLQ